MPFSRFPADLMLALETGEDVHGMVSLKLGVSGNVSSASLHPAS